MHNARYIDWSPRQNRSQVNNMAKRSIREDWGDTRRVSYHVMSCHVAVAEKQRLATWMDQCSCSCSLFCYACTHACQFTFAQSTSA